MNALQGNWLTRRIRPVAGRLIRRIFATASRDLKAQLMAQIVDLRQRVDALSAAGGQSVHPAPAPVAGGAVQANAGGRPVFLVQNIRLDNGEFTKPEHGSLLEDDDRCRAALRIVKTIFPAGARGRSIVDLGCLEGGYSVAFARLGMDTVGLEVRKSNFENCLYVKKNVDLPNLNFVNDDAWNVSKYGKFDVVFCCGLLYHLDRPVAFIKELAGVCTKALILNTHIATERQSPYSLSNLTENEGIRGRWYREYDPGTNEETLEGMKEASWANPRSFWPLKEHVPQLLKDAGFDLVFEQFDHVGDNIFAEFTKGISATHGRVQFLAIKS